jgi:hypothetical protein
VLPEYDWRGMREKIRGVAHAATNAAEGANTALVDHLLTTMDQIDREALDSSGSSSLPSPPVSQPAMEAV